MQFDPNNQVIQLCAKGMQLEAEGKIGEAHMLFLQAWEVSENNFERFTSAHYVARNQDNYLDKLKWNLEALKFAVMIEDETIKAHYPSLYLNVAKSYEDINDLNSAKKYYQQALEFSAYLPAGNYGNMIRSGINEGLKRTDASEFKIPALDELINNWCERKELKPLSLVLPAYLQFLGSNEDRNKLISALSYTSATRCLNAEDQEKTDNLVRELSAV